MDKIGQLTQLFARLDSGESADRLRQEAGHFLDTVSPKDLALAEQFMMQGGADLGHLRSRCFAHVSLLGDQAAKLRARLPYSHIVRTILAEHEMMLCFLAELEELNREIQQMAYCSGASVEIRKLNHIVSHIVNSGDHRFREDEVIFPELERHGYYGPPEIIKIEQLGLDACKREMAELANAAGKKIDFSKFKIRFDSAVKYLVPAMRQQIFTEDNILYPIAVEVITDRGVWERLKGMCDQIGYCGFDGKY
ncbi:MAG: hypothetical protein A2Y07_04455 [Planctomycetes bacterium GWF2_50_10]|nr:MAG: hypothetical protein A2Y07_04455 [Planctomycetes bacterium GWF2_50_10]